jgi:hypothetical protein
VYSLKATDLLAACHTKQSSDWSGSPRFCLGYEGVVPEQLATNKYIKNFPSSSGRENLDEHSVTCCNVDKNSDRDASDVIR